MRKIIFSFFVLLISVSLTNCSTRKKDNPGPGPVVANENDPAGLNCATHASGILGCWEGQPDVNGDMNYQYTLKIEPNQVSMAMTCKQRDQTVVAVATSRATVTDRTVSVHEDIERTEKGEGDFFCQALLQKMDLNYTIQGDELRLRFPDSNEDVVFKRR